MEAREDTSSEATSALPVSSTSAVPASPSAVAPSGKCLAPSLELAGPLDAYTSATLAHCENLSRPHGHCGKGAVDFGRFQRAVLPLDQETTRHVLEVARRGRAAGLNPRAFGLVGDSITVSREFLGVLAAKKDVTLAPEAIPLLALDGGMDVLDYYRDQPAMRFAGAPLDSFRAERAAKVGARASYASSSSATSPVGAMLHDLHPAIAVVTFGANDAAYRSAPPEDLADEFEKNLLAAVRSLEAEGVVVILENEMRHGDAPGVKACPIDNPTVNDWRISVSTNAIVRRTAEIACREHLPFVDLRYALDGASSQGLAGDAIHLSAYERGAGKLDEHGLDCGYDIRNLVTMMALRQVVTLLVEDEVFPPIQDSSRK